MLNSYAGSDIPGLLIRQRLGRRRIDLDIITTGTELTQWCILHGWPASFP
ncbi:MAG: hypothetical protein ACOC9S_05735 [Planctomycetota bacterium]